MQEVGPDEGVLTGVGQLVDAEVERRAKVEANEVVGACLVYHRYLVLATERADKGGSVIEPIRHMCRRAKPGQPH